jgi:sulfur carrier protein
MSEFRNSGSHEGIAVAVDEEVIPKSQWHVYQIKDGSSIEVITAVQGG